MTTLETNKIRIDGGTQPRSQIDMITIAEYAEAMKSGSTFPPVVVFFDGADYWLADGFHRYHAASQVNGKTLSCDIHQGTQRDAILYSVGANATHGMRRTNADKRQAVMTLLNDNEWQKWSDRKIAEKCAVSDRMVNAIRAESSANLSQIVSRTVERGGTVYEMHTANIGRSEIVLPEVLDYLQKNRNSDFVKEQVDKALDSDRPHVANNSGNNEWYTPPEYIEAARAVMGDIDLDPASSAEANRIVKAKKFYSITDSGLGHQWRGRAWMNPPYSADLIGQFTSKLCKHVIDCDVSEAIVLVNNATETEWFKEMAELASTVMFTFSRVKYLDCDLNPRGAPLQGQALLYFGSNHKKFIKEFSKLAWAVNRGKR